MKTSTWFFTSALVLLILLVLSSCSSTPKEPAWIRQPARTLDNGYIVYVGTSEDVALERATFKAESVAIGDLVNECTLAPKGARFEDHFDQVIDGVHHSYAKLGIVFEECEQAKNAIQPDEIRKLANVALTQQLKRYQDLYYEKPTEDVIVADNASRPSQTSSSPGPQTVYIHDNADFFIWREQVAYSKQVVILAPPTAYPPNAPQTTQFVNQTSQSSQAVKMYSEANPSIKTTSTTWSSVQRDPNFHPPANIPHTSMRSSGNHPPMGGYNRGASNPGSHEPSHPYRQKRRRRQY
jgi:hypothetical protein